MSSQPPPTVSPDGKSWWDGEAWVSFPKSKADKRQEHRMPGQFLPTWLIAVLVVVVFLVFVLPNIGNIG